MVQISLDGVSMSVSISINISISTSINMSMLCQSLCNLGVPWILLTEAYSEMT